MQRDDHRPVGWTGITNIEMKLSASELLHRLIICQTTCRRSKSYTGHQPEARLKHCPLAGGRPIVGLGDL